MNHDLEIEIDKNGKVRVHIQGVKGKGCLEYAQLLAGIVGAEASQELTSEFYEPDGKVCILPQVRQNNQ